MKQGKYFAGAVERFGVARVYRAIERVLGYPPEVVSSFQEAEQVYEFLEQEDLRHGI